MSEEAYLPLPDGKAIPVDIQRPSIATSRTFGSAFLDALGITDKLVTGFTLEVRGGTAVKLTVHSLVSDMSWEPLSEVIRKYEVVLKETAPGRQGLEEASLMRQGSIVPRLGEKPGKFE